jgi:ATP/maltotriose-dependent transcriptional regulator MalT
MRRRYAGGVPQASGATNLTQWSSDPLLLPPRPLVGGVSRQHLEARLGPRSGASWSLVVGPPGAGKTTLVRSWLEHAPERWSWIGIGHAVDRGVDLVELIARAIQQTRGDQPLDVFDSLEMGEEDAGSTLRRLVDELYALPPETPPGVIVLDDAHLLSGEQRELVRWLLERLPPALHVVIVSRTDPAMPLARARASGQVTEVRSADLMFTLHDTEQLLTRTVGHEMPDVARALHRRTEGWAAGVRLAAIAIRQGADPEGLVDGLAAGSTSVAEYLLEEVLDRLPADHREFVRVCSILDVVEPDICDAISGRDDSAEILTGLASDGLFVTKVEHGAERYRFHPLLGELLRTELWQSDPGRAAEAHRRAADWLIAHDRGVEGVEHLVAAGDHARAHAIVVDNFRSLYVSVHRRDLDRWLTAIPDDVIAESLDRSIEHCVALALLAHPDATRWWEFCASRVDQQDRWVRSRLECATALHFAVHADLDPMLEHWNAGRRLRPPDRFDPFDEILDTWHVRIESHLGDPATAVEIARAVRPSTESWLLDESRLSTLAGALDAAGDHDGAVAISTRALELWRTKGEPELPSMVDALVVQAAAARRAAEFDAAAELLDLALALPPPRSGPHLLTSIALIERARLDHARGGDAWQHQLIVLAAELRVMGAVPALADWVDREAAALIQEGTGSAASVRAPSPSAGPAIGDRVVAAPVVDLTDRERTILELLASHLSFPEIGAELYISRHTVKSHVRHVYEKLGASSRSEAIRIARSLGVLPDRLV